MQRPCGRRQDSCEECTGLGKEDERQAGASERVGHDLSPGGFGLLPGSWGRTKGILDGAGDLA